MKSFRSLVALIAVVSIVGFRSEDTFTLKQVMKKDNVETYEMKFAMSGDDVDFKLTMKNRNKVISVDEDGSYELEETLLEGTSTINGEDHAMDAEEPKTHKYDKDGKEVKKEGDEEENDPLSQVMEDILSYEPDHAVKIGESWDRDGEFGTVHAKLESREKLGEIDCLKISVKATLSKKETSGDVTGTFYVRASDFSPEKMEASIENPKFEEGMALKKIEMSMVRIEN